MSGSYYPAEALIGQRGRMPTLQSGFIRVNGTGGVHLKSNTRATTSELTASNVVVHISDQVLLPHRGGALHLTAAPAPMAGGSCGQSRLGSGTTRPSGRVTSVA